MPFLLGGWVEGIFCCELDVLQMKRVSKLVNGFPTVNGFLGRDLQDGDS